MVCSIKAFDENFHNRVVIYRVRAGKDVHCRVAALRPGVYGHVAFRQQKNARDALGIKLVKNTTDDHHTDGARSIDQRFFHMVETVQQLGWALEELEQKVSCRDGRSTDGNLHGYLQTSYYLCPSKVKERPGVRCRG